ncbi:MAG: PEP/pyruvate-binding domain-containing protein, partial [Neisseriaceae bacterium]
MATENIIWLDKLRLKDIDKVGGKNASIGEMISQLSEKGVRVPGGFATTADAFHRFLLHNQLDQKILTTLEQLEVDKVEELSRAGQQIRQWIIEGEFPTDLEEALDQAWELLCQQAGSEQISVAVRSSATAEDLPDASFAGQQETFLNIQGLEHVKAAIKQVFASLYNDRAISYRLHKGFQNTAIA